MLKEYFINFVPLICPIYPKGKTAWSSANSVDRNQLHVLQKCAFRAVNNSEYRSHSNPLFIKYNQLQISDLTDHNIDMFHV